MNRTAHQDQNWTTPFVVMLIVAIAIGLLFTAVAHAAGIATVDPTPAMTGATDVGLSVLMQDGPWWLGIAVFHVVLRVFLDKEHVLKQGRILSGLTALGGVTTALVAWHWLGAPSAGIVTAIVAGLALLVHPVPGTAAAIETAKREPQAGRSNLLALFVISGGGLACAIYFTVVISATSATGCDNPTVKAVGHALWDCTAPERAAAVDAITPVVVSVIKAAGSADGKLIDTSTVKAATTKANVLTEAGVLLSCALASAFAILETPASAPAPGSPALAPYVLDPAAVAAVWAELKRDQLGGADFRIAGGRVQ